jgi:hypothetical protein
VAHTLRGSADCFSAKHTVEAALRLELMGREKNLAGAEDACTTLGQEVERLNAALAAHVGEAEAAHHD